MLRAFKTEIDPSPEQKRIIHKTIGVCRFIYNFYIAHNKEVYEREKRFVSGIEFSKWLNNDFISNNSDYFWIKEVSSKALKQSIMNGEEAFRRFFKGKAKFPRFKKKKKQDVKMYFVKNDAKTIIPCERHKIKIPNLGWVKLKEYGYIPTENIIKSGTVSLKAGRYYVAVLCEAQENRSSVPVNDGIGIDLGIKDLAICSDGYTYKNINKTKSIKKLEKKLKREQIKLSRKYESFKERKNEQKGEATRQNIQKQVLKVQKVHQTLANVRQDYIHKVTSEVIKRKPSYITVEDLNISGMMKNRHLSRAIGQQGLYEAIRQLTYKSSGEGIELRQVKRFYPSSKTCNACGYINSKLNLSDRMFKCPNCGYIEDRDFNASLNLRDAKEYKVIA